jgi:hypothetical protein
LPPLLFPQIVWSAGERRPYADAVLRRGRQISTGQWAACITRSDTLPSSTERTSLGFKLTDKNAAAVAEVCQRLDGIPLAIELAAPLVKALSVPKIAQRLDDRFGLLTRGDRTALPRQQTLRASIEWSYDLLTEAERILLRRLGIFAGGWQFEAAEAVCPDEQLSAEEVLSGHIQLVSNRYLSARSRMVRAAIECWRRYVNMRQSVWLKAVKKKNWDVGICSYILRSPSNLHQS